VQGIVNGLFMVPSCGILTLRRGPRHLPSQTFAAVVGYFGGEEPMMDLPSCLLCSIEDRACEEQEL
jgi:hypothetical protein